MDSVYYKKRHDYIFEDGSAGIFVYPYIRKDIHGTPVPPPYRPRTALRTPADRVRHIDKIIINIKK